jgi:hypothetical protein
MVFIEPNEAVKRMTTPAKNRPEDGGGPIMLKEMIGREKR